MISIWDIHGGMMNYANLIIRPSLARPAHFSPTVLPVEDDNKEGLIIRLELRWLWMLSLHVNALHVQVDGALNIFINYRASRVNKGKRMEATKNITSKHPEILGVTSRCLGDMLSTFHGEVKYAGFFQYLYVLLLYRFPSFSPLFFLYLYFI